MIAGGTGLIGSHLSNKLELLGANVTSASIDSEERFKKALNNPKLFKYLDFRNYEDCMKESKDKDIVINLMGIRESTQLGVKKSATAMSAFLICNTNIIQASCKNNVDSYLFCGSINQYPPLELRREDDLWEGLPSANDKYVGVSKRIGELQAEAYSKQFNWDAVKIVRPSNVYGPLDNFNPNTAHVIPSLIHKIFNQNNGELKVAGDGSALRDFIYVDDLVDGILSVIEKGDTNLPFNLGSGVGVSIREVVETILEFTNSKLKIVWDTTLPTGDKKNFRYIKSQRKNKLQAKVFTKPRY